MNIINTIQETEPGTDKRNVEYPEKPNYENDQRIEINSWNWNFGDGQSSTLQSPSHIYEANGDYTVSLTVGDGSSTSIETKIEYIRVGNMYSVEEIASEAIAFYPNPANDYVQFMSEFEIKQLGQMESVLPDNPFFRISRSVIINMNFLSLANRKSKTVILLNSIQEIELPINTKRLKVLGRISD